MSTFQEVIAAVANLVMKAETVKKVRKKLYQIVPKSNNYTFYNFYSDFYSFQSTLILLSYS